MSKPLVHIPVLPREVASVLGLRSGEVYVDATCGMGGHAVEAARVVGATGVVVLNDVDPGALESASTRVTGELGEQAPRIELVRGNFARLPGALMALGLRADAVLADLGFSSVQMDDAERGLSFRRDGPLDMRLDPSSPVTAAELVNELPEQELRDVLRRFGEEPSAGAIARKVVEARGQGPILSTGRLAEIVREAARPRGRRGGPGGGGPSKTRANKPGGGQRSPIDPATRTFQALRIAVNDELGALERFLSSLGSGGVGGGGWLSEGARVAVISFHSLEDRAVKRAMGEMIERGTAEAITRGVVGPTDDEVARNPRARSAKLRAVRLVSSSA